mmetsp:Transcript_9472/g.28460  ORF Transcript_9472/g.28460 Transcript_9472/m.28460 type:complete len:225 (-) Transcript_9472:240-914(-)
MFARSAATDTPQSKAIHAVNERWGSDFRKWGGRETIGIPVCKKKYAPFDFRVRRVGEDGRAVVTVERMFGCHCHSRLRRDVIEKHGVRKGWEPFGQWSMSKATVLAKREAERLNGNLSSSGEGRGDAGEATELSVAGSSSSSSFSSDDEQERPFWKPICHSGICAWKIKSKYDDVFSEIHDRDVDSDEECLVSSRRGSGSGSGSGKMPRRDSDSLPLSSLIRKR